jgi:hypothetical protein
VYSYQVIDNYPHFELIQEVSTLSDAKDPHDAASALRISYDGDYLFCSTAGDDSVACYRIDQENGYLKRLFSLPTSGQYPKDIALFPDQKHIAVVNNGQNNITTFAVDYEKGLLIMKGKPQVLDTPNAMVFQKITNPPEKFVDISEQEAEEQARARKKESEPVHIMTEKCNEGKQPGPIGIRLLPFLDYSQAL